MSTRGSVAQNPKVKPSGSSSEVQVSNPGGGSSGASLAASLPRQRCTPVSGTSASLLKSSIVTRSHFDAVSAGGLSAGPIIATAAADVVLCGGSAVKTRTLSPRSARQIPVLSPMTPAPTTTASTALAVMPPCYWAAGEPGGFSASSKLPVTVLQGATC